MINMFSTIKNKIISGKIFNFKDTEDVRLIKTHKNNTQVLYFPQKKIYRKLNKNKKGKEKIHSENLGISWYCKRIKIKKKYLIKKYFKGKKISFIDLNEINGLKVKSWRPLTENYNLLIKFFKHYIKFYPKKKLSHIHGDLTFDNIIFNKKRIIVIDWEFFKASKSLYGYDLVYLFLSAACLPYLNFRQFSKQDEIIFKKLWKLLINSKISDELTNRPFNYFSKKIKSDFILKKSFRLSKRKFFPFITSNTHKIKIMKLINEIKHEN